MASSGDRLEELVLSGELFNPSARSSSPTRSASPASQPEEAEWPPADADYDEQAYSSTVGAGSRPRPSTAGVENGGGGEEIGMGPGRTGVKGVIRDRAEAVARERERRARDADALARRMERASLVGSGPGPGEGKKGRFGHLREVGMHGFLHAVEDEPGAVWVVVHIYEPSLQRCDTVDDVLVRLARQHTDTKFLRCRASALGYASLPRSRSSAPARRIGKLVEVDDEDDPYGEPEADAGREDDDEDDAEVDTDMLPTMHVYRAGELVYNWVRVDWEAGDAGLEELLARHGVIDQSLRVAGEDDGEDVLTFSGVP